MRGCDRTLRSTRPRRGWRPTGRGRWAVWSLSPCNEPAAALLRIAISCGENAPVARPWLHSVAACRSEEHTSELQSLMRISYAVFCLKKKKCARDIYLKKSTKDNKK